MKSKDLQKLVLFKYEEEQIPKKIFQDLNGAVSYRTVKRWCQMIRETGAIDLSKPSACHRTVRTKAAIQRIKRKSKGGKRISWRKLALEIDMSFSSAYRILRKDLKMKPYKKTVEPLVKDEHKAQRKKFANWTRKKFRKEDTMRILFSDGKMFDLDGIYNSENDRIWAVNREEANRRGVKKQQGKFPQKVMVWLAVWLRPLFCLKKALSIIIVISRKCCLLLYDMETVNLETIGPSNNRTELHILTKKRKNGVANIFHHFLTRIHGQRIVPI